MFTTLHTSLCAAINPLVQAHLWQLGRLMPPALCAHLEGCGVLPSLYAASWLMTCYSADLPASYSARWVARQAQRNVMGPAACFVHARVASVVLS